MDSSTKIRILKAIDNRQDEIIEFLVDLLKINSETGHEGEIQNYLADSARALGLRVDKWEPDLAELERMPGYLPFEGLDFTDRPNVVAIYEGTGGGRSLILNGHVDTITLEPLADWKHGPLSGAFENGNIYGRGSSDMKGGVAAMTMAVNILLSLQLNLRGSIFLEYVVDEEVTGFGTLSAIARGYTADAGICCETSDLNVQPACIGRLWFTVEIDGKTSSIATRWKGVSAIEKGLKVVQAVEELERIRIQDLMHPLYPDNRGALPCTVCMFESGTFPSAIPDRAVLKGSLGLMPYEDVQVVKQQFITQIEHLAQTDPWLRHHSPKITFKDLGADGAEIPIAHPIVTTVCQAYEAAMGQSPVISGRTGGADTRYLIKYGNTPTVIFGPGVTAQMHATNEYIPKENVINAVKTLALAIYDWCN